MRIKTKYKIILLTVVIATITFSIASYNILYHSKIPGKELNELIFFSAVTVFGLSIFLGILGSKLIFSPVKEITAVVDQIAEGNFDSRVDISTGDELEELARAVNNMNDRIELRMQETASHTSKFEAVLLSLFEGLMVVDKRGLVVLMNKPLKDFFRVLGDPVGKKPIEMIRNVEIQEVTDKILRMKEGVESCELSIILPNEKILLVHGTPVIREGIVDGAVLVFHDITELRRLEKVRQDFVANVSHELRTPVATIKGYAETLLDGALDDKEHAMDFLRIIHTDSDRLAKLINDLLDLSRIESGKFSPKFKKQSIKPIIDRMVRVVQEQSQTENIRIENRIENNLPEVNLDETLAAQIFLNLLENAVKYNREGGKVTISASVSEKFVRVAVADIGIGIPQEDLPRIFERFYRVDKAHSRQLGGTGLGLSIVKHIVQVHGGEISVESVLGQGSTFFVTFPKV